MSVHRSLRAVDSSTVRPVTREDLQWWLTLAPQLEWTFAATMPDAPHSYIVKGKHLDSAAFDRAVRVIRTFGEPGKFYHRTNIYLTVGHTKWWTMGAPVEDTVIINTADTEKTYGTQDAPSTATDNFSVYDSLATIYDARYDTPPAHAENAAMWRMITENCPVDTPTMLDIGAGTGLALDMSLTVPQYTCAVDPSQGMLNELVRKHPSVQQVHALTGEDYLDQQAPHVLEPFDLVISLFGSPSYMQPDAIEALPLLAKHTLVLMHYEPGYAPDYEKVSDIPTHDASRKAAVNLLNWNEGFETTLGRFQVVVVRRTED